MAIKYKLISELYDRTCNTVVANPQSWQKYLDSACRNYKLRFDEQLLIFAQRPDATAVLEIERWNTSFGRWVNKGAKGIAVFEDANRSRQRLIHYFDISDTHESRYSRLVPIWEMKDEYADSVIETLESSFGELERKNSLGNAIMSAAQNAVEDNLPDYLSDLVDGVENSFLEELNEDMISNIYKKVVTNSVAYMMMSRLGIDTKGVLTMKEITYTKQGDYLIPDLTLPEQPELTLGRWSQMRRTYLKQHHKILYYNLLTKGILTQHLAEVQERATDLEENLVKQMAAKAGLTEQMKAEDMMKWVGLMNNIRNSAQEIVKEQIIFA